VDEKGAASVSRWEVSLVKAASTAFQIRAMANKKTHESYAKQPIISPMAVFVTY
jgi:hypothetical protein